MKAIAIDDEPLALEIIKAHGEKVPFIEVIATFSQPLNALAFLQANPVDLIFLDIKMPDISGMDLYNSLLRKPLVIFTTAYAEHAVTSFELDAIDYLLKPFSLARFMKACNKAYELFKYRSSSDVGQAEYCLIKSGNEQIKVLFSDILIAEATGNYVTFTLVDKKITSRSTFAEVLEWLPEKQFIRIHRSYLVNQLKIDKADKTQVYIKSYTLPLSEAYSKIFFEKWK
jgi:DNA-binding LytR/AlgR family response regulator